jgi:hypothetical protein
LAPRGERGDAAGFDAISSAIRSSINDMAGLTRRWPRGLLLGLLLVTTGVRLFLGSRFFGFLTGDDVEILEAGFRVLGLHYTPLPLRNTLVSDLFVAPVLVIASHAGCTRTEVLVWLASWPFVASATLNIFLVYRLSLAWTARTEVALTAACLYGAHWIPLAFGSMTYPRILATTFVLGAALLVARRERVAWADFAAGACLAIAFAVRYSEAVFLAPLLLAAAWRFEGWRSRLDSCLRVGSGFVVGVSFACGLYEWWSAGQPFLNLLAFARYTLIEGKSSSLEPHQPIGWYFWRLFRWWCPTALLFAWLAARYRRVPLAWLFVVIPVLMLSMIHHKELRYLQGVIPFVALLSAAGAVQLWDLGWRRVAAGVTLSVVVWGVAETSFLARKSMPSVLAARALNQVRSLHTLALVQLWGYGDHLYLGDQRRLVDIPYPTTAASLDRLGPEVDAVGLYEEDLTGNPAIAEVLRQRGFCRDQLYSFGAAKAVRVLRRC